MKLKEQEKYVIDGYLYKNGLTYEDLKNDSLDMHTQQVKASDNEQESKVSQPQNKLEWQKVNDPHGVLDEDGVPIPSKIKDIQKHKILLDLIKQRDEAPHTIQVKSMREIKTGEMEKLESNLAIT